MSDLRTNMASSDIEGADLILQLDKANGYIQQLLTTTSPIVKVVNTVVLTAGQTYAIPDVTTAVQNMITFGAGNATFTFPVAAAGKGFLLALKQDSVGSRTITWPSSATVRFGGGTAPTLSTGANKTDYIRFECLDGTHWDGYVEVANV